MPENNVDQPKSQTSESLRKVVDLGQVFGGRTNRRPPTPEEKAHAEERQRLDEEWLSKLPEEERRRELERRRGPVQPGKQRSTRGFDFWQAGDIKQRGTGDT